MASFDRFGVWELVPRPPRVNAVSCKRVFKLKYGPDGKVNRLKSLLTARGFSQRTGQDYSETWVPTCRQRTFHLLMAEASALPKHTQSVVMAQWDCTAAFL